MSRPNRGRNAAIRNRKRKRRLLFFYASMFFIVLCAALILALTILFKVEAIEVQGISRYSTEEVTEASGLETVSYTHLDVYKRQSRYLQLCAESRGIPPEKPFRRSASR